MPGDSAERPVWVAYDPARFAGAPLSEAAKLTKSSTDEVLSAVATGLYQATPNSTPEEPSQVRVVLPSLDVVLNQAKESVESVGGQSSVLDTKASFVLI